MKYELLNEKLIFLLLIGFRPEAIQTYSQVQHVRQFEEWLKDIRKIFGCPTYYYRVGQDLQGYMNRQHKYLHGQERRDLQCIPKVTNICLVFFVFKFGYN
jgi:hypothetical protein